VPGGAARLVPLMLLTGLASLLEGSALVLLVPIIEGNGATVSGGLAVDIVLGALDVVGVVPTATNLVIAFGILALVSAVLTWTATLSIHAAVTATDARMRRLLFDAVMGLAWPKLAAERGGDIVKALNTDPLQAGIGLNNLLLAGTNTVAGLTYLAIALVLSWQLTLVSIGFAIVVLPVYLLLVAGGRRASQTASRTEASVLGHVQESVGNAKLLFAQGLRQFVVERYETLVERYRSSRFKQDALVETSRLSFEFVAVLFVLGILLVITTGIGDFPISLGLVFLAVFYRLAPKIITVQGGLFRAANHAAWVQEWLARAGGYGQHQTRSGGREAPTLTRGIEIRGGNFSYRPDDADDVARIGRIHGLRNIDLDLPAGGAIALTGPSGHGKSTLVDVISGLISLDSGAVRIDGADLQALDVGAWQRMIGLVPQEAPLFHGSIAENVALGEAAADLARLAEALSIADAEEFVAALPGGAGAMVGEHGHMLSGGQRQRIALARALYRRPKLLILDEATSALDGATAARVVANLAAHKGSLTIVAISHEPHLLSLADHVYEMRNGELVLLETRTPNAGSSRDRGAQP
jgi:ATP-binding cassette subfamily C protein